MDNAIIHTVSASAQAVQGIGSGALIVMVLCGLLLIGLVLLPTIALLRK